MAHTCNPSTQGAQSGRLLQVQGQPEKLVIIAKGREDLEVSFGTKKETSLQLKYWDKANFSFDQEGELRRANTLRPEVHLVFLLIR